MVRYNADGSLDTSFGTHAIAVSQFGTPASLGLNAFASGIALRPNGKIVISGTVADPTTFATDFGLAQFNPDGSADQHFGTGGGVFTAGGNTISLTNAGLALQPDGEVVVVGSAFNSTTFASSGVVARYNPDGTLDQSFGSGGLVTTASGRGAPVVDDAVALGCHGAIVAVGWTFDAGTGGAVFLVAEYVKH
jgi:uncharacterized delta-60 repeat protein